MNIPKEEIELEAAIQEKGLTRPRITPERINSVIKYEEFTVIGTTTICVIHLINGFTVTGESACVDPNNFDIEIGRTVSRNNARKKIWVLEGYLLQQQYYEHAEGGLEKPLLPFITETLKNIMQNDSGLAWSYQCNLAISAYDEGVDHKTANKAAARFMKSLYGVDVTQFDEWKAFERMWNS